jgi:hypothetical protein
MQIIIPTRGRTDQQLTLQQLPRELLKRTTLVCSKREASGLYRLYGKDVEIMVEPYPMKISEKRGWIVQEWWKCRCNKIIMLDDDLSFATRISAADTGLRKIRGKELIPEFQRIEDMLGPEFPHVGFGLRYNNNHENGGWKIPGKMQCALGYYLPIVAKEVSFNLVELREDFCVALQLLLTGHPNAVWTGTVVDQRYGAPGGCSIYRTTEMNSAEAEKLAALFPDYVRVVEKDYELGPRKEVVCHWRKALRDGLANLARPRPIANAVTGRVAHT